MSRDPQPPVDPSGPPDRRQRDDVRRFTALRRRIDVRWLLAAAVAVVVVALAYGLFGPEPPLVVSPRTTWITRPLAADGLPDYAAHLLESAGPAPPPGENAAVPLLAALWPLEFDPAGLAAVCRAIGIPATPPAGLPLERPDRDAVLEDADALFTRASEIPWRGDEAPQLGDWLARNTAAIDLLVEASGRPRYWLPSPSLLHGGPQMLFSLTLPDLQDFRTAGRALVCRGLWHAGEGRFDEAWRDVLAVHRLARLLAPADGPPPCLVARFVAIAVATLADRATLELVGSPGLPDATLAAIRRDLSGLAPCGESPTWLDAERLFGLDAVVWLRHRAGGRRTAIRIFDSGLPAAPLLFTSLDWNVVTAEMNAAYDRMAEIAALPTFAEREAAAKAFEARYRPAAASGAWDLVGKALQLGVNRGERSGLAGRLLLATFLPSLSSVDGQTVRQRCLVDLVRVAAALEAARRDDPGHAYPAALDALVPRYLPDVPDDAFTGRPFVYRRMNAREGDAGYLLYGLGPNRVDDGGTDFGGWIVHGEWQERKRPASPAAGDMVVRMPMPKRTLTPAE